MDTTDLRALAERMLAAWTSQDVARVLDCYTDDLDYRDPSTRGPVRGREAMGRYLERLFAGWRMTWALRELWPYADGSGANVLWRATFAQRGGGPTVELDGMDLVVLREGRIARNEVVFDRTLLPGGDPSAREREARALLVRSWMTHDAMWYRAALEQHGVEAANRLNLAAIRAMAPIEARRVKAALGLAEVGSLDALERFLRGARELLVGDLLQSEWSFEPPDVLRIRVDDCFAEKGITRLGAIERYECGIYERVWAWLDALGVTHEVSPPTVRCTRFHEGTCERTVRLGFPAPAPGAPA